MNERNHYSAIERRRRRTARRKTLHGSGQGVAKGGYFRWRHF